jgi:hypothetical protein
MRAAKSGRVRMGEGFRAALAPHRAYLFSMLWIGVSLFFVRLFTVHDWDEGPTRFLILLAIPPAAYVVRRLAKEREPERALDRAWAIAILPALLIGAVWLGTVATASIQAACREGSIPSDQGQSASRSIDLLLHHHGNPYGRTAILALVDALQALQDFESLGCGSAAEARAWVTDAWSTPGAALISPPYPDVPDDEPCASAGRLFEAMGFRYGPVLLASYAPFVASQWEAGILMSHALLAALGLAGLFAAARNLSASTFVALAACALVVLARPLRWEIFEQGHSDLLPTALAAAFWFLRQGGRPTLAAVALGLSMGAKTLPGLIWLPLLVREPRALLLACSVAAAGYAPFVIWDARGVWYNLTYVFLSRYTDSTSIVHYLSPVFRWLLSTAALGTCAFLGWRAVKAGDLRAELDYLIVAHVAVLASASVFHNNYLVWLLPVLVLVLVEPFLMAPGRRAPAVGGA